MRETVAAAALAAHDREPRRKLGGEGEPARERRLAFVLFLEIEVAGDEGACDRHPRPRLRVDQLRIEHPGHLERFEEKLVLALGVFLDLIEIEELFPRIGELLVSGDHRHQ